MPTARRITARPITARRIVGRPIGVRGVPDRDMILVFDTTLATGTEVIVPLHGTVDCTVDWGDGTSDSYTTTGNKTHTYAEEGEYTVRISGTLTGFGADVLRPNLTKCLSFGEIGLTSLLFGFKLCPNFIEAPKSLPKHSTVTTLQELFGNCTIFNDPNVIGWDVSGVNAVFGFGATFFATAFNQDVSGWDVSNASNFFRTFRNNTAFNQDVSGWDVSGATSLNQVVLDANNFDQDLGAWPLRVAGVTMNRSLETASTATGMSVENYSRTLIGWANYVAANGGPFDVPLGAVNRQYNDTAYTTGETYNDAVAARAYLTTATADGGAGWTIEDSGEVV